MDPLRPLGSIESGDFASHRAPLETLMPGELGQSNSVWCGTLLGPGAVGHWGIRMTLRAAVPHCPLGKGRPEAGHPSASPHQLGGAPRDRLLARADRCVGPARWYERRGGAYMAPAQSQRPPEPPQPPAHTAPSACLALKVVAAAKDISHPDSPCFSQWRPATSSPSSLGVLAGEQSDLHLSGHPGPYRRCGTQLKTLEIYTLTRAFRWAKL